MKKEFCKFLQQLLDEAGVELRYYSDFICSSVNITPEDLLLMAEYTPICNIKDDVDPEYILLNWVNTNDQ